MDQPIVVFADRWSLDTGDLKEGIIPVLRLYTDLCRQVVGACRWLLRVSLFVDYHMRMMQSPCTCSIPRFHLHHICDSIYTTPITLPSDCVLVGFCTSWLPWESGESQ